MILDNRLVGLPETGPRSFAGAYLIVAVKDEMRGVKTCRLI